MPTYICERTFTPPLTVDQFAAGGKALAPCIQAREVTWVSSSLSMDGARSVCTFEAADAERVREANQTAGLPFDKVYAVRVFTP